MLPLGSPVAKVKFVSEAPAAGIVTLADDEDTVLLSRGTVALPAIDL